MLRISSSPFALRSARPQIPCFYSSDITSSLPKPYWPPAQWNVIQHRHTDWKWEPRPLSYLNSGLHQQSSSVIWLSCGSPAQPNTRRAKDNAKEPPFAVSITVAHDHSWIVWRCARASAHSPSLSICPHSKLVPIFNGNPWVCSHNLGTVLLLAFPSKTVMWLTSLSGWISSSFAPRNHSNLYLHLKGGERLSFATYKLALFSSIPIFVFKHVRMHRDLKRCMGPIGEPIQVRCLTYYHLGPQLCCKLYN